MHDTAAPIQRYSRVGGNATPLQRTTAAFRPRGAVFAPRLGNAR